METLFVTGGSGFIGREVVRMAAESGYRVAALCRSETAAAKVRALNAEPIMGDLLQSGAWQNAASSADAVLHIAQPLTFDGRRISRQRAEDYRTNRLKMDAALLDCLGASSKQRIVYVGGTSFYGDQGEQLKDERAEPNPRGWGPYIVEALTALRMYVAKGWPIIEAFPGAVYGAESWYGDVLKALHRRQRLVGLMGGVKHNSSIHVEDCARAILHLMQHGQIGERYFLVDDRPNTTLELAERSAAALEVPLRTLLVPPFLAWLLVGPVITDSLQYTQRLSNAKLRGTGFTFNFPTIEQGVPDVARRWKAAQTLATDPSPLHAR